MIMMRFEDQTVTIETPFGPTRVRVTGAALLVWWGEGAGPQDATGLLAANAELIKHLATIRCEADEVEDDGIVGISEMDAAG
jgi:hypothetical protein